MEKYKSIYFIIMIFLGGQILFSKPLIAPDTVYISPAYYNPKLVSVGIPQVFEIQVNNESGVEIISMHNTIEFSVENPEDKSYINCIPVYFANKNGNIVLEDNSTIGIKALAFFSKPKSDKYETKLFISYKTKEFGFKIDTIIIIANRVDSEIHTKNQILTRDACHGIDDEPAYFTFYSGLLNGSNQDLTIEKVEVRSNINYEIKGYLNELSGINSSPNISYPYTLISLYYALEIRLVDSIKQSDFIYVDYYTDKGLFTDTLGMIYSQLKGITAKTPFQYLKSFDYESVLSKKLAIRMCSEKGYKIKSIKLEGEFDASELELEEFYKVGDVFSGNYAELSQFKINPKNINFERIGEYIYELENLSSGNIIEVNFPFNLKVDVSASVINNLTSNYLVYPNPSNNIVNISNEFEAIEIELIDLYGKTILKERNKNSIDVSTIQKGVYILKATSVNSNFIEKIIID